MNDDAVTPTGTSATASQAVTMVTPVAKLPKCGAEVLVVKDAVMVRGLGERALPRLAFQMPRQPVFRRIPHPAQGFDHNEIENGRPQIDVEIERTGIGEARFAHQVQHGDDAGDG